MNMTAEKAAYRILVASASDKMVSVLREVLTGPQYRDISCVFTMASSRWPGPPQGRTSTHP